MVLFFDRRLRPRRVVSAVLLMRGILVIGLGWSGLIPAWAGEYFTEEVTSPSIEVIHGWKTEVNGIEVTISNSSRGSIEVPMEATARDCGSAEMVLQSGRVLPIGSMDSCILNLFPFLDKLINQEVSGFRVALSNGVLEIPVTEDDRLLLARVGNQSRETFILFQKELARVMDMLREATGGAPISEELAQTSSSQSPTPLPIPTPESAAAANEPEVRSTSENAELVIVGGIQEERSGAGSRLRVEAINPTDYVVLSAVARFDFYQGEEIVDTRRAAFNPSDVLPGQRVTAEVVKTEADWDRVTVSFEWRR